MIFKIVYNNEIHLLKKENPTLKDVKLHVKKTFPTAPQAHILTYKDADGDEITISSQQDFTIMLEEQKKNVKLFVKELETQKKIEQSENQQNLPTHPGVQCDGCNICPLVGNRFKCSVCQDFDFCSTCIEKKELHDSKHPFIKFENRDQSSVYYAERKNQRCPFKNGPPPFLQPLKELFKDPAMKQVGQGLKELFNDPAMKQAGEGFKNIFQSVIQMVATQCQQKQTEQTETPQEQQTDSNIKFESPEQQETQNENEDENEVESQILVENIFVEENEETKMLVKATQLAGILNCSVEVASEYLVIFKDLALEDIVDIISEQ